MVLRGPSHGVPPPVVPWMARIWGHDPDPDPQDVQDLGSRDTRNPVISGPMTRILTLRMTPSGPQDDPIWRVSGPL